MYKHSVYKLSYHSHKKRKDSLYIEISLVSWNLPNGPKHWGSIFKHKNSSDGDQLLAGAFRAIIDKIEALYFKLQRSGIENESSHIKHTFSERFKL